MNIFDREGTPSNKNVRNFFKYMETLCSFSPNIRSKAAQLICFKPVSDGFIVMKLLLHCEKGVNSWYLSSSFHRIYHYEDDTIDKPMRESGSVLWNGTFQQCFFS